MPFFDDSGPRLEEHRGPLFSAFITLYEQVERMVALNIGWAIIVIPALVGIGVQELPLGLRIMFVAITILALPSITMLMFGLLWRAAQGELIQWETTKELFAIYWKPGVLTLFPLYSIFVWLFLLTMFGETQQIMLLSALAQLGLLLTWMVAQYWGPLIAEYPQSNLFWILRRSIQLAMKNTLLTLFTSIAVVLAILLGILSIGGTFLIIPVLAALLQVHLYRHISNKIPLLDS